MTLSHLLLSVLFEAYDARALLTYKEWLAVKDNLSVIGLHLDELECIDERGPASYHNPK